MININNINTTTINIAKTTQLHNIK